MENKELEMKKAPVVLDEEELEMAAGGVLPVNEGNGAPYYTYWFKCKDCGTTTPSRYESISGCDKCHSTNLERSEYTSR